MPKGWGGSEVFFDKYLKAQGIQKRQLPTLELVMSAEEGMKTPRTRNEFVRQNNLPSDYFTTDNATRGRYNEEWRKRKAITLPLKPELYPGAADIPQPVTDVYPLPPVQFDLSRVGKFGDGDKILPAGGVERADNTRVASGRPQQVLSKIPYGAGKGQAGQNPLVYLWNNPYVAGTMMAMGPIAMRGSKKFEDLVSPKNPLMDFKPEMFLNIRQVLRHRDPKGIGKLLENKYGPAEKHTFNAGTEDVFTEAGWRLSPELYQEAMQLFK